MQYMHSCPKPNVSTVTDLIFPGQIDQYDEKCNQGQITSMKELRCSNERIRRIFNLRSVFPTWVAKVDSYAEASGPREDASNKVITNVCGEKPTRRIRN